MEQVDPLSHRHRSVSLHPEFFDPNFDRQTSFKAQGMELVRLLRVSSILYFSILVSVLIAAPKINTPI